MPRNTAKKDEKSIRREMISSVLIRVPNITQSKLAEKLYEAGIYNHRTEKPYSATIINRDIQALRQEWQERTHRDVDKWYTQNMMELEELKKMGWANDDGNLVLKAIQEQFKVLGLYAPQKLQIVWKMEIVQLLISGQIDIEDLKRELNEPEIIEGIITDARSQGYAGRIIGDKSTEDNPQVSASSNGRAPE